MWRGRPSSWRCDGTTTAPTCDNNFIYWPTCVEIAQEPDHSIDLGIVEATRRVIGAVQSAGGRAVASADFEDQL
jgi:hypothetical protein